MGSIFVIQGILIYIYGFDHNPPHIHVRSGTDDFSITIKDRIIEGVARSKTVAIINQFMDEHENELMDLWEKAQNGETIKKNTIGYVIDNHRCRILGRLFTALLVQQRPAA